MVYSKEVTAVILSDMARGASAEETQKHLADLYGKAPHTNTIYTHRHSITAEQIVDELIRQQQRDITKEDNSDRRMYYRDKLLDKLMQLKIEIVSKNLNINKTEVKHVIELVDPDNPAQTYPPDEVQAARRANIIPP
mgnify:CR=1 FL=1